MLRFLTITGRWVAVTDVAFTADGKTRKWKQSGDIISVDHIWTSPRLQMA